MRKWMKITIPIGAVLAVSVGGFVLYEEVSEDRWENELYARAIQSQQSTQNGETMSFEGLIEDIDGKVTEVSSKQITIDVPLEGAKTYAIDGQTRIENLFLPLKKGVLVDIDTNGETAYHIETQRTMDSYGVIKEINDTEVVIEANGQQQTFKKASSFRIDADGYKGAIQGLPAEITFNSNLEIVGLEIELDFEGGDS